MWVVDEAPARCLGHGQLISMKKESGQTGPGILSATTDLRQHWITWSVSGGPERVQICVPIPWAALTGVEAVAHAKHFHTLPASPAPHAAAPPLMTANNTTDYPYAQSLNEDERRRLEGRLESITKKCWRWRPEGERRRRHTKGAVTDGNTPTPTQ